MNERRALRSVQMEDFQRVLNEISVKFSNLRPFWNMVLPLLHNMTMRKFGQAGPGWASLAPSTIRQRIYEKTWRVGVGSDQPILQRHGDLRRSLMASNMGASPDHIQIETANKLIYGTNMRKAIYLQGDVDKWIPGAPRSAYAGLSPRPFLYFTSQDEDDILIMGVTYLEHVMEGSNG